MPVFLGPAHEVIYVPHGSTDRDSLNRNESSLTKTEKMWLIFDNKFSQNNKLKDGKIDNFSFLRPPKQALPINNTYTVYSCITILS